MLSTYTVLSAWDKSFPNLPVLQDGPLTPAVWQSTPAYFKDIVDSATGEKHLWIQICPNTRGGFIIPTLEIYRVVACV